MISVIITTYNRRQKVEKSLNSILNQSFKDIEVIVIDDGSNDDTESFFKNSVSDSRVRYIKLEQNSGATYARNFGIKQAKGDWVLVWDSDDLLNLDALEVLLRSAQKNPSAGIISAPAKQFRNGAEDKFEILPEGFVTSEDIFCKRITNNEKVRLVKSELFKNVFYEAKNVDFLVNLYLINQAPWYHLQNNLAEVYIQSDSLSLTTSRKKHRAEISIARTKALESFFEGFKSSSLSKACPERWAAYLYGAAIGHACGGDKVMAVKRISEAVFFDGNNLKYKFLKALFFLPFGVNTFKVFFETSP